MLRLDNDELAKLIQEIIIQSETVSTNDITDTACEAIAEGFNQISNIISQRNRIFEQRKKARAALKKTEAELDKQVEELENMCPHYSTTYFGDASGGSDSHSVCDVCGAEVS